MRFPAPTTTHSGCTQNFTGVWNQTSRTESSPDCTSLSLDRRAEQRTPLTEVQEQWAPRRSGAPEPGLPDRKSFPPTGGSFPAETWRLPPGSHPLLHRLRRETAEHTSHSVLPKKSQNPSPKHRIRICQFPKPIYIYERFWKKVKSKELREKKKGSLIWLCLRGEKKPTKPFPSFPLCHRCVSFIWWQSPEC